MKRIKTSYSNPDREAVNQICEILSDKGVIVYPTDTVYGLGSLFYEETVEGIYRLKERERDKPFSVVVSSQEMVGHYANVKERLRPGPYTYIVEKTENTPDYVTSGLNTVGIRVLDSGLIHRVVEECNQALVTTSANKSGETSPKKVSEVPKEILEGVDLVVDSGVCEKGAPSKIIDLTRRGKILRR